jgi:glycosyltransferase involved in cell wall biosynthesis
LLLARHLARHEGADVRIVGVVPLGAPAGLVEICEQEGLPVDRFELRHKDRDRLGKVWDLVRFGLFLRRARVDVLLPYCMIPNVLCGLTWRLSGARVCIWNQRDEGRSRVSPWVERLAVRQTRSFVSNSRHGADFVVAALGVAPERVQLIHNGVELPPAQLDRSSWRRRLALSETAFLACMVANLHSYKDHETLIAAWRLVVDRLWRSGREAHLLLAGAGDQLGSIRKQVQEDGLADRVHFLGFVGDIAGLLRSVDLAVFSSYSEGVPNAVLEAMAAGLAVVASDHAGVREAVGAPGTPSLVRQQDPSDLAEMVVRVAQDEPLRARLGAQGRIRAATEFGVERMTDEMVRHIVQQGSPRFASPAVSS